jgi:hypothetical protein
VAFLTFSSNGTSIDMRTLSLEKGSDMHQELIQLDGLALFFLGKLAEHSIGFFERGKLPRGCNAALVEVMLEAGYISEASYEFANGHQVIGYAITQKGRSAWRDYQFI